MARSPFDSTQSTALLTRRTHLFIFFFVVGRYITLGATFSGTLTRAVSLVSLVSLVNDDDSLSSALSIETLSMVTCRRVPMYHSRDTSHRAAYATIHMVILYKINDLDIGQFKYAHQVVGCKSRSPGFHKPICQRTRCLGPPLSSGILIHERYSASLLSSCSKVWMPIASRHQTN